MPEDIQHLNTCTNYCTIAADFLASWPNCVKVSSTSYPQWCGKYVIADLSRTNTAMYSCTILVIVVAVVVVVVVVVVYSLLSKRLLTFSFTYLLTYLLAYSLTYLLAYLLTCLLLTYFVSLFLCFFLPFSLPLSLRSSSSLSFSLSSWTTEAVNLYVIVQAQTGPLRHVISPSLSLPASVWSYLHRTRQHVSQDCRHLQTA